MTKFHNNTKKEIWVTVKNDWVYVEKDYSCRKVYEFSNRHFNLIDNDLRMIFKLFFGSYLDVKKIKDRSLEFLNCKIMFVGGKNLPIPVEYFICLTPSTIDSINAWFIFDLF